MIRETPRQPMWCCSDCGNRYGQRIPTGVHIASYHNGLCEVCGVWKAVTEPRDFGYLKRTWRGHNRAAL